MGCKNCGGVIEEDIKNTPWEICHYCIEIEDAEEIAHENSIRELSNLRRFFK